MSKCPVCEEKEEGLIHPSCSRTDCPGINSIDILVPSLPIKDHSSEAVDQASDVLGNIFDL